MNIQSIVFLVGLVFLLGFAVYSMIRRRKQGKRNCGGCSGNCAECVYGKMEGHQK